MKLRKVSILFMLFFSICSLFAQQEDNFIALKAFVTKDSIMLRWAPSNFATWQKGIKYGYKVERILFSKKGIIPDGNDITTLAGGKILPLPMEMWESVVKTDSVWAPIALQALWGETFELSSSFQVNMMEAYNKVKENDLRFGFALYSADMSIITAKSLGLYLSEPILDREEQYIYRVSINANDTIDNLVAHVSVNPSKMTDLFKPQKAELFQQGKSVIIRYKVYSNDFVGYYFERSHDGKTFQRMKNELATPFLEGKDMVAYCSDSIIEGKHNYIYRVIGLSPFGFESAPSDTFKIKVFDNILAPANVSTEVQESGRVRVSWKYKDEDSSIKGFKIARSSSALGEYIVVTDNISPKKREWLDLHPLSSNYYKVIAFTASGTEAVSLESFTQLNDSTPPLPPTMLIGTIDTLGVVKLSWKPNDEQDLMGYKVFRGNNYSGEFAEITDSVICQPNFTDTIELVTLTKNVFYKLVALDKRYNTSKFSKTFTFNRPDLVSPAPPVLTMCKQVEDGVKLEWISSPSIDLEYINIYRCDYMLKDTILLDRRTAFNFSYLDTTKFDKEVVNDYWLLAVDSARNFSKYSNSMRVIIKNRTAEFGLKLRVEVTAADNKPIVRLVWNSEPVNKTVNIYKREKGKDYFLIKTLTNVNTFDDTTVLEGMSYEYLISKGKLTSCVSIDL